METVTAPSSVSAPPETPHKDELFMERRLIFADTLKDLKNLRKQLYSAAEYFEESYVKEEQKDLVMETMKDYVMKSFINTVDHLGSVAYKINGFLDENIDDVPRTELRITCIQQRLNSCQEFNSRGGLFQQSLVLNYPKFNKHYTFPAGRGRNSVDQASTSSAEDGLHQFDNGITRDTPSELVRNRYTMDQSPLLSSSSPRTFHFTSILSRKSSGKRSASPLRFPLIRAGSLAKRSVSPSPDQQRNPSVPRTRRSGSISTQAAERERPHEIQAYSSKSNNLFKALLSMRKPRPQLTTQIK